LYVNLVRTMQQAHLDIHYMANITGHGWRKIMRAAQDFTYELHTIPEVPEEFDFMQSKSGVDDSEMYGNFNMGAGYAIYLPKDQASRVVELASELGLQATIAGEVKAGPKQVIITPKHITFSEDTLGVR